MPRQVLGRTRRNSRAYRRSSGARQPYTSIPISQIESVPTAEFFTKITLPNQRDMASSRTIPLTPHPPFFNIGDEVLYNHAGYRTKDEIGQTSPFGWRQWRTYTVRRNEYFTSSGKWMYQIAEIGGESVTLAEEEHLIDITYSPLTRVELAGDWYKANGGVKVNKTVNGGEGDQGGAVWVVKSCRLVGKESNSRMVVYDIQNECGSSLKDEKFNVTVEELVPYGGPKPDANGGYSRLRSIEK